MTPRAYRAPRGGLLARLWPGSADGDAGPEPVSDSGCPEDPEPEIEEPADRRRRHLLEDISSFLMTHRLAVTPFTLDIAHDVVAGANPVLSRLVARQVEARAPITLEWLESVTGSHGMTCGVDHLAELVDRLEETIARFASTTHAARAATSGYSTALEAHVEDLAEPGAAAGTVIAELAGLAHAMLSHTREVERELSRSERETRDLQVRLADARREAEVDHLTGLPNRRAFETELALEYDETRASGEALCVAFCDIDNFKRINDIHGHEAGDRILRKVAQTLSAISDERCHVARHGGEEFVVLLRDRPLDEAFAVLDAARATMSAKRLVNRTTQRSFGRISFSAGIADVHAHASPSEALRAADAALYRAKREGRDRVERAEGTAGPGSRDP